METFCYYSYFSDQFVTQKLLLQLGIERTCVLRGDYHHLMNEAWPKSEIFGQVIMDYISKY